MRQLQQDRMDCPYTKDEINDDATISGGTSTYFFGGLTLKWSYDYKQAWEELKKIWN